MHKASAAVPEVEALQTLAYFYEGVGLLQTDQSAKALPVLKKCEGKLPLDYGLASLILNAESGIAFDKKDYDSFVKANQDIFTIDSTLVTNWYGLASAYSCRYAVKGDDKDKTQAFHYLAGAHKKDSLTADNQFYYNMIEYRLVTHNMITRENFKKQYPHGWTKP